jgi:hypothetical protein
MLSLVITEKIETMGITKDNKKFERTVEQTTPTNPTGNRNIETNKVDFDKKTIKKQQNKK